jgi:hypothetical protein
MDASEDLFHVLIDCPWARRFWGVVKESLGTKMSDLHPATWATDVLLEPVCSRYDAAILVCGCWSLWTNKNGREHGRSAWHPNAAAKHISGIVEELMNMIPPKDQAVQRVEVKWKPPLEGWIKINSDGSLKGSLGHGAGAAVLRNNEGVVVAAQAKWYGPITDALEAEVMAARDGLLLAKKLVISDVVLETDCSVLVKALPNDSMAGP